MPDLKGSNIVSAKAFLVRGEEAGRSAWYIVAVDKLKMPIFQKMLKSGSYNLPSIGNMLASGWGENPPESIRKIHLDSK